MNEDDSTNYSHAKARRLPAEVLYDALHRVTGSQPKIPGVPPGTRAAQLPDAGVKTAQRISQQPGKASSRECLRMRT